MLPSSSLVWSPCRSLSLTAPTTHTRTCARTHTHTCMHTHPPAHTRMHAHPHTHMHACTHTHAHAHTCAHTHTRTHTLACILVWHGGPGQVASSFSGQDCGDGDAWADSGREAGWVTSPLLGSQVVMSNLPLPWSSRNTGPHGLLSGRM